MTSTTTKNNLTINTNVDTMDASDPNNDLDESFVSHATTNTTANLDDSDASLGQNSWVSIATPNSRRTGTGSIPTTYENVTFHGSTGRLLLTADKIYFQPHGTFDVSRTDADSADQLVSSNEQHHSWRWKVIAKHQISPAHAKKPMLKLISNSSSSDNANTSHNKAKAVTFSMEQREQLEAIRKDISRRLRRARKSSSSPKGTPPATLLPLSPSTDSNATPTAANHHHNDDTETTALLSSSKGDSTQTKHDHDNHNNKNKANIVIALAIIVGMAVLAVVAYWMWMANTSSTIGAAGSGRRQLHLRQPSASYLAS